jgi:hypothetical protein
MSDTVIVALIVAAGSAFNAVISLANNALARRSIKLSQRNSKHIEETKVAMGELKKNTNSMKDALVKVTGEKFFAEGIKQGTAEEQARVGQTKPDNG